MADTKISDLPPAGALAGTEPVPIVQGAATVRATVQDIANLAPSGTPAASAVTYDNTTSGLTATNVQAAIDEVAGASPVIPDDQIVRALTNSWFFKKSDQLFSLSGNWFDVTSPSLSSQTAFSGAIRDDGKLYLEMLLVGTFGSGFPSPGVGRVTALVGTQLGSSNSGTSASWSILANNGSKYNGSVSSYGTALSSGDVVMIAVDLTLAQGSRKIWWGRNGTWFASGDPAAGTGEAFANITGPIYPGISPGTATCTIRLRASEFSYSPPTGFSPWVT